jgi:acyl-CoA thioesterase-1
MVYQRTPGTAAPVIQPTPINPFPVRLPLVVTADVPTITYTDSTGGSGPTTSYLLPADPRLTYRGAVYGTRTVSGSPTMINLSNGYQGSTDYGTATNIGTTQPFSIEFDHYGTAFTVNIIGLQVGYLWQVYVDGQPASLTPLQIPDANTASGRGTYALVTFAAARLRRIRVTLPGNVTFRRIYHGAATDAFGPAQKQATRCYMLGDSWAGGTGATSFLTSLPAQLELLTGWEMFRGGQSGSGYIAAPSAPTTAYGSTARLNSVVAANPDIVIVQGTSNDDANTATVGAAAAALYTALATQVPKAKVVVVGAQNTSTTVSANRELARAAIRTAALAAPNVVKFIDPITDAWITGTGNTSAPGNDGNASVFVGGTAGTDNAHLNDNGYAYYARRILQGIAGSL